MAFKILSATFLQDGKHSFTLDFSQPERNSQDSQFTLLIGKNGVGKSLILEAIVDFLFYVWVSNTMYSMVRRSKYIFCTTLVYYMNGATYKLDWKDGCLHSYIDGEECSFSFEMLPRIVATSFSLCDKFKIPRSNEREQFHFYKYIGAKVNGNMISPTSILFTLLSNIAAASQEQLIRINNAINAIGYELYISFRFKLQAVNDKFTFNEALNDFEMKAKETTYAGKKFRQLNFDEKQVLFDFYEKIKENKDTISVNIDLTDGKDLETKKHDVYALYKFRQMGIINLSQISFRKVSKDFVSCIDMSSGEFNMLATIISVASVAEQNVLVLMDEPEISQHPSWQMSIIDYLDKCLKGQSCHLLIATHSNFLVSDLPLKRSEVLHLYKDESNLIESKRIESNTYGWSAEEVLLKVFDVPTTRNRYLADIVGELMNGISKDTIKLEEVQNKVCFLKEIVGNLNDIDPMKKIIETIIETFEE